MVKSQDPRFTHECGAGDGTSGSKNAEPVPPLIDRRFIGAALTRTKSATIFPGLLNKLQAHFLREQALHMQAKSSRKNQVHHEI
jgi:hypothetical protein